MSNRKKTWADYGSCVGMKTEWFYDDYEEDQNIAKSVDDICSNCPVQQQCLAAGIDGNEYGVWGGVWLVLGVPDIMKNTHKTEEMWDNLGLSSPA